MIVKAIFIGVCVGLICGALHLHGVELIFFSFGLGGLAGLFI